MLDPIYKKNDAILTNLNNVKLRKSDRLRLACKSKNLYIHQSIYLYKSPWPSDKFAKTCTKYSICRVENVRYIFSVKKGMTSIGPEFIRVRSVNLLNHFF